jgi:hypothetical protein
MQVLDDEHIDAARALCMRLDCLCDRGESLRLFDVSGKTELQLDVKLAQGFIHCEIRRVGKFARTSDADAGLHRANVRDELVYQPRLSDAGRAPEHDAAATLLISRKHPIAQVRHFCGTPEKFPTKYAGGNHVRLIFVKGRAEAWFVKTSANRGRMPLELLDRPTILANITPPGRPEPAEVPEGDEEEDEEAK